MAGPGPFYHVVAENSDDPEASDELYRIDMYTHKVFKVGELGFNSVHGLAVSDGILLGYTGDGKTLKINSFSGKAKALGAPTLFKFSGAAGQTENLD